MNIIDYLTYFHFLFTLTSGSLGVLNQNEQTITFDLIRELNIRQCILIRETQNYDKMIDHFKSLSSEKIFVTCISYDTFFENLNKLIVHDNANIGLIFKDKDLISMNSYISYFHSKQIGYKMKEFVWLVFANNSDRKNHKVSKHDLPVPYDCEFIVIESKNEDLYKLTEVYDVKNRSFSGNFGMWTPEFGLETSGVKYLYERRRNLNGSVILMLAHDTDTVNRFSYIFEIFGFLAHSQNFKIQVRPEMDDPEFKIGDVKASSLHIFISDYFRKDMLGPIYKIGVDWYIRDSRSELYPDYYFLAFDVYSWIIILLFVLIGTGFMIFIQFYLKNENRCFVDNAFMMIEYCCNQCGNDQIRNDLLRMIGILFRITVVFVMVLYDANITTYLSLEHDDASFTNVEEFMEDGRYKLQTPFDSVLHSTLKTTNYSILQKLYSNFTITFDRDDRDFIKKICYENLAVDNLHDDFFEIRFPCGITKIKTQIMSFPVMAELQENSPFTKSFNYKFQRVYETGIQAKAQGALNSGYSQIPTEFSPEEITFEGEIIIKAFYFYRQADLKVLKQVLCIPLIGITLGVVIFICEFMHKYGKRFYQVVVEKDVDVPQRSTEPVGSNYGFITNVHSMQSKTKTTIQRPIKSC